MECGCPHDKVTSIVTVGRVTAPHGGFDCFSRELERIGGWESSRWFACAIDVSQLESESEYTVAEMQEITAQPIWKSRASLWYDAIAPNHSSGDPPRPEATAKVRIKIPVERLSDLFRAF